VLVGEQPGNDEDREGVPFVAPPARARSRARSGRHSADGHLRHERRKALKWEPRGKRRLHKKPGAREISACLPWLEKELELVKPRAGVLARPRPGGFSGKTSA